MGPATATVAEQRTLVFPAFEAQFSQTKNPQLELNDNTQDQGKTPTEIST